MPGVLRAPMVGIKVQPDKIQAPASCDGRSLRPVFMPPSWSTFITSPVLLRKLDYSEGRETQRTSNWRQRRRAAFLLVEHVGRPGLSLHISEAGITSVNSVAPGLDGHGLMGLFSIVRWLGSTSPSVLISWRVGNPMGTQEHRGWDPRPPPAPTRPYKP